MDTTVVRPAGAGARRATPAWAPYLLVSAVALVLRAPTLSNNILSIDEPDYFAQAARLQSFGDFVYSFYYRIETKAQIGLIPYIVATALDRANALLLVHLFGLLAVLAGGYLLIAFGRWMLGSAGPGLAATLIWLPYLEVGPGYALGGHSTLEYYPAPKLEYFQTPFLLAALYGVARVVGAPEGLGRRAERTLFAAGVAWALAVLIKPSALAIGPLCLVALLLFARAPSGGRPSLGPLARAATAFVVGGAIPALLVFGPYLFNPAALAELRFNLFETTTSYAVVGADPLTRLLALLLSSMPPWLFLLFLLVPPLARLAVRRQIPAPAGAGLGLTLWSVPLLVLTSLPGCTCPYYMIGIIPLMALVVAGYLALALRRLAARGRPRAAAAIAVTASALYLLPLLPALLAFPAQAGADSYRADDARRFDLPGLLGYIAAHTRPAERIWVFYNTPEIYLWSDRLPATRDPQADWLSFVWSEPWFTRNAAELAAEQPRLIIGINQPRLPHPHTRPLLEIPQVSTLIARAYRCDPAAVRGTLVCTRRN